MRYFLRHPSLSPNLTVMVFDCISWFGCHLLSSCVAEFLLSRTYIPQAGTQNLASHLPCNHQLSSH